MSKYIIDEYVTIVLKLQTFLNDSVSK
jgi:hypothetical protein